MANGVTKKQEKEKLPLPIKTENIEVTIPDKYLNKFSDSPTKIDYAIGSFQSNYENLSDIKDPKKRFESALRNMERENYGKKDLDGNDIQLNDRGLYEVKIFLRRLEKPITQGDKIDKDYYEYAFMGVEISQNMAKVFNPENSLEENVKNFKEEYAEAKNVINEEMEKEFLFKIANHEKMENELKELEQQQETLNSGTKRSDNSSVYVKMKDPKIGEITINTREYNEYSLYEILHKTEKNKQYHLMANALRHALENSETLELNGKKITSKEQKMEIINHLTRGEYEEIVKRISEFKTSNI